MESNIEAQSDLHINTDLKIEQYVIAELEWGPAIDAKQIAVKVNGNIVFLNNLAEKWYAERMAQQISDVKALVIKIDVKLADSDARPDTYMARTAKNVLQ
jgi:osmotically-inducible protein OsmY